MASYTPKTLITFDYEGRWGMPYDEPYNLTESTDEILDILRDNGVSAVFFAVGQLIEEEPEIISKIADEGHAIGVHGYRHEHLGLLTPTARNALGTELKQVSRLVTRLTGRPPVAFRAPYLLWPNFTDAAISEILLELGFLWTSNREIRFTEELFRPDRIPWNGALRLAKVTGALSEARPLGAAILATINARHLWRDAALGSPLQRLSWFRHGRPPFQRSGLVEVPLGAPLDCDLLGLPTPTQITSEAMIEYATSCLIEGAKRIGYPYVLTFHDWIIGSSNRPAVLKGVLGSLREQGSLIDGKTWMPRADVQRV